MSLRAGKFADIPRLVDLLHDMHRRSRYADCAAGDADVKEAKATLMQAMQRHGLKKAGGTCVFVWDSADRLDAFVVGSLQKVYLLLPILEATDIWWYAREDAPPKAGPAVFDAYLAWASDMGASEIRAGVTDAIMDHRKLDRFYRRRGFGRDGALHRKELAR